MASTRAEARDIVLETDEVLDPNDAPVPREPSCIFDAMVDSLYRHAYGPFMYLPSSNYDLLSSVSTTVDNQI